MPENTLLKSQNSKQVKIFEKFNDKFGNKELKFVSSDPSISHSSEEAVTEGTKEILIFKKKIVDLFGQFTG